MLAQIEQEAVPPSQKSQSQKWLGIDHHCPITPATGDLHREFEADAGRQIVHRRIALPLSFPLSGRLHGRMIHENE